MIVKLPALPGGASNLKQYPVIPWPRPGFAKQTSTILVWYIMAAYVDFTQIAPGQACLSCQKNNLK